MIGAMRGVWRAQPMQCMWLRTDTAMVAFARSLWAMDAPQHGVTVPAPAETTLRAREDKDAQPHRALTPVARGINRTFATVRPPRADADGR